MTGGSRTFAAFLNRPSAGRWLVLLSVIVTASANAEEPFEPKTVDDFRSLAGLEDLDAFEGEIDRYVADCMAHGTGGSMDARCFVGYEVRDRELNVVYARLRKTLDPVGREELTESQRDWIRCRDSTAAFNSYTLDKYFDEPGTMWASMRARRADVTLSRIVKARTLLLLEWEKTLLQRLSSELPD